MSNELQVALRGNRPDYVLGTPLEGWAGPQVVRWRSREAIGELFCYEIVLRRLVDDGANLESCRHAARTLAIHIEAS
jgi:hypothetical protein